MKLTVHESLVQFCKQRAENKGIPENDDFDSGTMRTELQTFCGTELDNFKILEDLCVYVSGTGGSKKNESLVLDSFQRPKQRSLSIARATSTNTHIETLLCNFQGADPLREDKWQSA